MSATDASDDELLAWLGREEPEPVLEPELEIIDPHHHLWDHRACFSYSCMLIHTSKMRSLTNNPAVLKQNELNMRPTLSTLVAYCLH